MGSSFVEVENLEAFYGKFQAVFSISMSIEEGNLVGLIGPNGAGKTTTLKAIAGQVTYKGSIKFNGQYVDKMRDFERFKKGICYVPEGRGNFPELRVEENLKLVIRDRKESGKEKLEFIYKLFPILRERGHQIASTLSGGEQRMLSIAQGFLSSPKLLLIDELSLGLAPIMSQKLVSAIEEIKAQGITIILVDQFPQNILKVCDKIYVMRRGRITLEKEAKRLTLQELKEAYFGD